MDFGIDRLIEMFEARFGKLPATVLLALVGVAVAGLAVKIIATDIIIPSWKVGVALYKWTQTIHFPIFPLAHFPITKERWGPDIVSYIFGCFATLFSIWLMEQIWKRLFKRSLRIMRFLAPTVDREGRDLRLENRHLKARLAKYEPSVLDEF